MSINVNALRVGQTVRVRDVYGRDHTLVKSGDGFLRRTYKRRGTNPNADHRGKQARRAHARLAARVAHWEGTKSARHEQHKPGSLKHHG